MDDPGAFSLGDFAVGGPATLLGDVVDGLGGLAGLGLSARLAYGSGGAGCLAFVQTSLDGGQSWLDLAAFGFAGAGGLLVAGLVPSVAAPFAPTDGGLAANTLQPGAPLGDRLRAKVIVSGTYGGSTLLSLWACAR